MLVRKASGEAADTPGGSHAIRASEHAGGRQAGRQALHSAEDKLRNRHGSLDGNQQPAVNEARPPRVLAECFAPWLAVSVVPSLLPSLPRMPESRRCIEPPVLRNGLFFDACPGSLLESAAALPRRLNTPLPLS